MKPALGIQLFKKRFKWLDGMNKEMSIIMRIYDYKSSKARVSL